MIFAADRFEEEAEGECESEETRRVAEQHFDGSSDDLHEHFVLVEPHEAPARCVNAETVQFSQQEKGREETSKLLVRFS